MYLLQSDQQLWRAWSNDDGNSFSNYFSSCIGKECVSPAWTRGQPFLQHPKYDHPVKKTMCAKQHIFGTFKSKQLLLQPWHCCTGDQQNDVYSDGMQASLATSSEGVPYVLLLLCCPWSDGKILHVFIHLKENQIRSVFQYSSKSTDKKARPQKPKHEKKELFILMRSSVSSSYKHSDRSSKNSWQCYINPELFTNWYDRYSRFAYWRHWWITQNLYGHGNVYIYIYIINKTQTSNHHLKICTKPTALKCILDTMWGEKILELETGFFRASRF